ncbi:hypothetical protein PoB_003790100 [Plakobranchus ocellatus]|uniref:Uncharacterized protein n=1 Tax=Plakobranchus ocellatus TaxID=259542 RepID=A0AAV4AJM8_9GAST|nr:hypothetical protein PoB_003790100 [Plakobranchus ocellatus]
MAGFAPASEGPLQISGRIHKPLCYRGPPFILLYNEEGDRTHYDLDKIDYKSVEKVTKKPNPFNSFICICHHRFFFWRVVAPGLPGFESRYWPDGGPESLKSQSCGLALYIKPKQCRLDVGRKKVRESANKPGTFWFLYIASPQQGDLRLSGPPLGHSAGGGARTRTRRVSADPGRIRYPLCHRRCEPARTFFFTGSRLSAPMAPLASCGPKA